MRGDQQALRLKGVVDLLVHLRRVERWVSGLIAGMTMPFVWTPLPQRSLYGDAPVGRHDPHE